MKAYLIDPNNLSITEVDYDGSLEQIYKLCDYSCFTVATFNDMGDGVYVDDEGLLKPTSGFFMIDGYNQPLAGKGLVLGVDDQGESIPPSVTLDWLKEHTTFFQRVGPMLVELGRAMERH